MSGSTNGTNRERKPRVQGTLGIPHLYAIPTARWKPLTNVGGPQPTRLARRGYTTLHVYAPLQRSCFALTCICHSEKTREVTTLSEWRVGDRKEASAAHLGCEHGQTCERSKREGESRETGKCRECVFGRDRVVAVDRWGVVSARLRRNHACVSSLRPTNRKIQEPNQHVRKHRG